MSPLDRLRWVAAVGARRLPATCYRLAAHVALMASDGSGTAWASRPTLAKEMGCDEARLPLAFRALEAAGFLVRGELAGPVGRQTYRWTMTLPPAEVAPGAESAPPAEVAGPPPAEVATDPLRKSPPKGGSEGGSEGGSTLRADRSEAQSSFETWWNLYAKKTGRKKAMAKWMRIKADEREKCLSVVLAYVAKTPDANYRKDPLTYLNGEHWADDLEGVASTPTGSPFPPLPPEDDDDDGVHFRPMTRGASP